MKRIIRIGKTRYEIENEDDLITIIHVLAHQGFTVSEISYIVGIPKELVQKYLEDCW